MATKPAEAGKADQDQVQDQGTADGGDEKRYIVTEQELQDLKTLKASRHAVRLIHSLDGCPECPETFNDLWEEASNEEPYTAQMLACFAASMVDSVAGLHKSSKVSEAVNEARLDTLHGYAGMLLTHSHGCTEGHTGCVPADPK
jgi:hypothetical protein